LRRKVSAISFLKTLWPSPIESRKDMVVGILQIELRIDWAESLKDKRRVLSSLKDRLHREHQVSVAEVDGTEDHRIAVLGIVMASGSAPYCRSVLDKIVDKLRHARGCVLSDHRVQVLSGCGSR
jgi:uncharacterized protein YlxP (DUF503 family)